MIAADSQIICGIVSLMFSSTTNRYCRDAMRGVSTYFIIATGAQINLRICGNFLFHFPVAVVRVSRIQSRYFPKGNLSLTRLSSMPNSSQAFKPASTQQKPPVVSTS